MRRLDAALACVSILLIASWAGVEGYRHQLVATPSKSLTVLERIDSWQEKFAGAEDSRSIPRSDLKLAIQDCDQLLTATGNSKYGYDQKVQFQCELGDLDGARKTLAIETKKGLDAFDSRLTINAFTEELRRNHKNLVAANPSTNK